MKPQRIQRKRIKGFKLPPNTVCVSRGTMFGNPFVIEKALGGFCVTVKNQKLFDILDENTVPVYHTKEEAAIAAVRCFKLYLAQLDIKDVIVTLLKGKNLACFCSLDAPCHGDVLLAIASERLDREAG